MSGLMRFHYESERLMQQEFSTRYRILASCHQKVKRKGKVTTCQVRHNHQLIKLTHVESLIKTSRCRQTSLASESAVFPSHGDPRTAISEKLFSLVMQVKRKQFSADFESKSLVSRLKVCSPWEPSLLTLISIQ